MLPWRDPEAVVASALVPSDVAWHDAGAGAATGTSTVGWGPALTGCAGDGTLEAAWAVLRAELPPPTPVPAGGAPDPTGWAGWLGHGTGRWLLGLDPQHLQHGDAQPSQQHPQHGDPLNSQHSQHPQHPQHGDPLNSQHSQHSQHGDPLDPQHPQHPQHGDPHQPTPDLALLRLDHVLTFDHATGVVEATSVGDPAWHDDLAAAWPDVPVALPEPAHVEAGSRVARWDVDGDDYLDLVRRCQAAIRDGEAYQLCLTTTVTVEGPTDALATYARLRRSSPAPHAWFVRVGGTALLCASPERALAVGADGVVASSPIKGTRPRYAEPERDAASARELLASEKERAENLMIVDLVRNDLSRVCRLGTVAVTELLALHSHPHVHQLVSTVRGELRPGATVLDALAACLPAGSMTGAPKRRAVQLLDAWEPRPRGAYAGVVGRIGSDGTADLAMVIRSLVVGQDRTTLGVGGGITSSSVPADEMQEARLKAAAPLAALGAR
ncbi:hypothetical protein GCM10027282_08800 [Frigoribacterium salinisoli]